MVKLLRYIKRSKDKRQQENLPAGAWDLGESSIAPWEKFEG